MVSNEGSGCQDREDNDIKIYFNGQLNNETTDEGRYKRCEGDEECGECGRCSEEKICIDYDNLCQAPTPYCINGSCEPCPAGETLNSSGKCQACPADENSTFRVTNDEAGAAACHKCGDWFKQGDVCMSCNRAGFWYPGSKEECFRCPNRLWDYNVRCYHCDDASALGPIPRVDCNRCPNRYMPGDSESGTCYYCDGMVSADRKSCIWACPTGTFGGKDKCVDCETGPQAVQFNWGLLSHETEKEFCDTCANRVFLFQQNPAPGICAKKCREGQFLDGIGNCRTCDDGSFYMGWTETMGQVGSSYGMTLPSCRSCDGMVPQAVTNANCIPCDSTSDPIQTWYGTGDCARCPGRIEVFNDYSGEPWRVLCVFPCDQNQIHDGNSGTCYDCEEIDNHGRTTVAQCHTCENRFVFRGDCRHCSDPGSFFISTEECLRCKGKRYTTATVSWQSGECRLCPEKDSAEWQALSPTFQEQCND